ncbi:hypothetical protein BDV97DRAFT_373066 [Delphinella strobiligena]|nr:hypothetical protein BDV97DRAFT_373066 [Delphinella strobiligena]
MLSRAYALRASTALPRALARSQHTSFLSQSTQLKANDTTPPKRRRNPSDDIHRPSLSGSSVGHLIAEISSSKPGMEGLRPEGQTMNEEQRTFARRVVTWLMGVPVVIGTVLVGSQWISKGDEGMRGRGGTWGGD